MSIQPMCSTINRFILATSTVLLLPLLSSPSATWAQDEELTTEAGVVNVPPSNPDAPSGLTVASTLRDSTGDQTIGVLEPATLALTVTNHADGPAADVEVVVTPEERAEQVERVGAGGTSEGAPWRLGPIESIAAGATKTVTVDLRGAQTLSGEPVVLSVSLQDEYGFAPEQPTEVTLPTQEGGIPALALAELRVDRPAGDRLRPNGDTTEVTVQVENEGTGAAEGVTARLTAEAGGRVISPSDSIGPIEPQASAQARFAVAVSGTPETVPLSVQLRGQSPRAAATARRTLTVEQPDRPPLVDRRVPSTNMERPNDIAVVLGVKEYEHTDVPDVDYALRDARTVRKYLTRTLGFREENVIFVENASGSELRRIFGTSANPQGQLYNYVRKGESEVFVYYSGHGAPNPETEQAYLLGADTNPSYMSINGYPATQLYENLANLPAKSVTVALDACFSGVSEGGQIVQNVSPAVLKVENPMIGMKNGLALTAGAADQVSSWYPEKKHGLFTYYFLKGLRGAADTNDNKTVTAKEMEAYLTDEVPYRARRMHNREQVPQVVGQNMDRVLVKYEDSMPAEGR